MTTANKATPASKTQKPSAKPVATTPVVATAAPKAAAKPAKIKKVKMVRDSLSMPKPEYAVLDALKLRAAKLGRPVKKTEIIRAGIKAVAALTDSALLAALQAVPSLKTGRPANAKAR